LDNVTHTIIGALVGEVLARRGPRSIGFEERRRLFVPTLAIGSNLPDLDLLYTGLVRGKLDYLLHHRGHTHTLLGACLLTLLFVALYGWLWRRRRHVPTRTERIALIVAAFIGPMLHIAMDATNSYGVHPYWPFDSRWRYGDAVFIIEPLFWAAAAPLVLLLRSLWARIAIGLVLVAGVGLSISTGMVPQELIVTYAGIVAVMLWITTRWREQAAIIGAMVWLGFTAMFMYAGHRAQTHARALLARALPNETILDVMQTPMPMNPVCWELMLVHAPDGGHYTVRRAMLSLLPDRLPANQCPSRGLALPTSAPLEPVSLQSTARLQWYGERTMPRVSLQAMVEQRCEVGALLQFARIPWFEQHGTRWRVGDLRYDREPHAGFAEIEIDLQAPPRCPFSGAPWIPPREDLLR
jgi:inner membrane protein